MFRLIRMLILFMSPEPVINHHFIRESLDEGSAEESEVAPTYRREGNKGIGWTSQKTSKPTPAVDDAFDIGLEEPLLLKHHYNRQ